MVSAWITICAAIIGLVVGWMWGRKPVASLRQQLARLEESLALSLANKAELTATFKALSAEALSQNNHSFLHLATTSLERFYEGARVDLAHRQQAIDQCLQPIKLS